MRLLQKLLALIVLCLPVSAVVSAQEQRALTPSSQDSPDLYESLSAMRRVSGDSQFPSRGASVSEPALSPNGRWLTYLVSGTAMHTGSGNPGHALFIREFRSGQVIQIAPNVSSAWLPVWSPDSENLAFFATQGESDAPYLWLYTIATKEVRRVCDRPAADYNYHSESQYLGFGIRAPSWNPDGKTIIFSAAGKIKKSPWDPSVYANTIKKPVYDFSVCNWARGTRNPICRPAVFLSGDPNHPPVKTSLVYSDGVVGTNITDPAIIVSVDVTTGRWREVVGVEKSPAAFVASYGRSGKWIAYYSPSRWGDRGTRGPTYYPADLVIIPAAGGEPVFVERDVDVNIFMEGPLWLSRDRVLFKRHGRLYLRSLQGGLALPLNLGSAVFSLAFGNQRFAAESPDGESIVVVAEDRDNERAPWESHLFVVPLDGRPARLIKLPDGYRLPRGTQQTHDMNAFVATQTGLLWQPEKNTVTVIAHDTTVDQDGDVLLRAHLDSDEVSVLWRGQGLIMPWGATIDQKAFIACFEGPSEPPDLWLIDADGKRQERLTDANPKLRHFQTGEVRFFKTRVPGWDGHPLTAVASIVLPAGRKPGERVPAIMTFYPGHQPASEALQFAGGSIGSAPAAIFLNAGYAVIYADMPRHPGGALSNRIQGTAEILVAQAYQAAALGYIDIGRVALEGYSRGGYLSAAVVTETNLFRAAISGGASTLDPVGSPELHDDGTRDRFIQNDFNFGVTPWENLQRYLENSPYAQVEKINTPIFLFMGGAEPETNVMDARKFFAALAEYNKPAEFVLYPGADHMVNEPGNTYTVDLWRRMVLFLNQHMKTEGQLPVNLILK